MKTIIKIVFAILIINSFFCQSYMTKTKINNMIESKKYIEYENEPELKPEFIKKINKIKKEKSIRVDDFAKRYGLDV